VLVDKIAIELFLLLQVALIERAGRDPVVVEIDDDDAG
jgi:hypothetical protein